MTVEQIEKSLLKFLENKLLMDNLSSESMRNSNLFSSGLIDSYGLIELISFLEKTFEISITDEEIADSSLISVSNIVNTVIQKLNQHD